MSRVLRLYIHQPGPAVRPDMWGHVEKFLCRTRGAAWHRAVAMRLWKEIREV